MGRRPLGTGSRGPELTFAAADGTRLSGLWLESPEPQGVVVYAHGNAGNLSHRIPIAEVWEARTETLRSAFRLSRLRSQSGSPGTRVESCWTPWRPTTKRCGWEGRSRWLQGEAWVRFQRSRWQRSGRFVACSWIRRWPVRRAMAPRVLPLPGIGHLVSIKLDNVGRIGRVQCPILILHGELDRVVPIEQGREVHNAAREATFVSLEGLGHNEPRTTPEILNHLRDFVASLKRSPGQ